MMVIVSITVDTRLSQISFVPRRMGIKGRKETEVNVVGGINIPNMSDLVLDFQKNQDMK